MGNNMISVYLPGPPDVIVTNEGFFVGIPDPKKWNIPGGDWHPGWGGNSKIRFLMVCLNFFYSNTKPVKQR